MKISDHELVHKLESEIQRLEERLADVGEEQYLIMKSIRWNINEKKKFIRDLKAKEVG